MVIDPPLSSGEHIEKIRNVYLWYLVRGQGPVLIVQPGGAGWGGDATPYINTFKRLEEFQTIVYLEPRGIGKSQRSVEKKAYSMEEYVEDLEALRRLFDLKKVSLAGHSHGGFVTLKYAIKYPKNVDKLILIDTTPSTLLGDYQQWFLGRKGAMEALTEISKIQNTENLSPDEKQRIVLKIILPIIHFYNYNKFKSNISEILNNMIVSSEPVEYFRKIEYGSYDIRKNLHKITAKTLIILGEDEMPSTKIGSGILHSQILNSTLKIIENCGHWPFIEEPDLFFKAVIPFLSK